MRGGEAFIAALCVVCWMVEAVGEVGDMLRESTGGVGSTAKRGERREGSRGSGSARQGASALVEPRRVPGGVKYFDDSSILGGCSIAGGLSLDEKSLMEEVLHTMRRGCGCYVDASNDTTPYGCRLWCFCP